MRVRNEGEKSLQNDCNADAHRSKHEQAKADLSVLWHSLVLLPSHSYASDSIKLS